MSDAMSMPLGKCVQFLSGGTPSMQKAEYWGGDIPWVSAKDLKTLVLRESQDHLSKLGATSGTRMVGPGAILMLVRGMTLHHDIPICIAGRPLAFNQDIKALIPDEGMIDGRYLLYALLAKKDILLSLVDSAGHGTGRLNTDQLKALPIPLPPLATQQAIVKEIEAEQALVAANRELITRFEKKIQATLARVCGGGRHRSYDRLVQCQSRFYDGNTHDSLCRGHYCHGLDREKIEHTCEAKY